MEFGTGLAGPAVTGQATDFNTPKQIAWLARWNMQIKGTTTRITITRLNGPGPHPLVVWSGPANVKSGAMTASAVLTSAQMKARQIKVGGKYEVAYVEGAVTLASGEFEISNGTSGPGTGY
jgi:hypothetical protein